MRSGEAKMFWQAIESECAKYHQDLDPVIINDLAWGCPDVSETMSMFARRRQSRNFLGDYERAIICSVLLKIQEAAKALKCMPHPPKPHVSNVDDYLSMLLVADWDISRELQKIKTGQYLN